MLTTSACALVLLTTTAFAHDAKDSSAFRPDTQANLSEASDGTITGNFATVPMGVSHPVVIGHEGPYGPGGGMSASAVLSIPHVPANVQAMDNGHLAEGPIRRTVIVTGTKTDPSRGSSWAGNPGDCDPAMGDGCADRLAGQN